MARVSARKLSRREEMGCRAEMAPRASRREFCSWVAEAQGFQTTEVSRGFKACSRWLPKGLMLDEHCSEDYPKGIKTLMF